MYVSPSDTCLVSSDDEARLVKFEIVKFEIVLVCWLLMT
jgi:hypothetical protein